MAFWSRTIREVGIGYLVVTLLCAVFSFFIYRQYIAQGQAMIRSHASMIAHDLWQFDEAGAGEYLKLAAITSHYKNFQITELSGNVFLTINSPDPSGLDALLVQAGLIPVHTFKADILYKNHKIGMLVGSQYLRFIYPCFNFLIFLLLLMFTTLFIVYLFSSRKLLQNQVADRTRKYQESERRYQDLVTMLPEIVWEADLDGKLVYANKIAFERFGYEETDLTEANINVLDILIPEDRERAAKNYAAMLRGEHLGFMEYTAVTKNGETFPIHVRSAPVYRDGISAGGRGLIIDITEQRKLEHQLRQAQKMEAIGTLAGGIAHDFNNILTAIMGYIQLVQMELRGNTALFTKLDEALKAAARAKELVQQILTFSRKAEHSKQPLQLSTMVKETIKLIRSSIPSTIEIRQQIETSEIIMADATRMHQMIMNLCTNAYQSMEGGGVLSLRLRNVDHRDLVDEAFEPHHERYIEFTVSDTGCGMEPEIVEKIFDPYFTTKDTGEGTGLGLAMVHGIVEEHEGFIKVKSELNRGTTFRVFLPVAETDAAYEPEVEDFDRSAPSGYGETIMMVDDEEQILDITRDYLSRLGYQVETYQDAAEALMAFSNAPHRYNIIITDQTMPHKTGIELCMAVKHVRPECAVILCSGYSTVLNDETLERAGVNIFLQKPLLLQKLAASIRELIDMSGQTGWVGEARHAGPDAAGKQCVGL